MSTPHTYTSQYKQIQVQTADPFELLILLHKGAISRLRQAERFLDESRIEPRVEAINKALAMIGELQAALDFEKGKEIATQLDQLYNYMIRRLAQSNARIEVDGIHEVISLLGTLLSAWEEAAVTYRSQGSQADSRTQKFAAAV